LAKYRKKPTSSGKKRIFYLRFHDFQWMNSPKRMKNMDDFA
jgi:hypothetical protein